MPNPRKPSHSPPNARTLTAIAQDPSVRTGGKILVTELTIPAEELLPGPCGYRVNVIDYDSSTDTLYEPAVYKALKTGHIEDPFALSAKMKQSNKRPKSYDRTLVEDPRFHAQNVYAIAMRTLAQFEFALGRRVPWGSDGHQLHIAPHAFADANAFYSRDDRAIFFGYFTGASGKRVYTCLSHDVVAHETTHAILDGLRRRYLEPSTPDQAAFHEGFADIVALLSLFSLPDVVGALLDLKTGGSKLIAPKYLEREALQRSVLLGLAEEMGSEVSAVRGQALRRSAALTPGKDYMHMPEYQEEHARGQLIVAAMMNAVLEIWLQRLAKIGPVARGMRDRSIVVEEGARVAGPSAHDVDPRYRLLSAHRHLVLRLPLGVAHRRPRGRSGPGPIQLSPGAAEELRRLRHQAGARHRRGRHLAAMQRGPALWPQPFRGHVARPRGGVPLHLGEPASAERSRRQLYRGAVGAAEHSHRARRLRAARNGGRVHPDPDPVDRRAQDGAQDHAAQGNSRQPHDSNLRRRHPDLQRIRAAQVPHSGPARGPGAGAPGRAAQMPGGED